MADNGRIRILRLFFLLLVLPASAPAWAQAPAGKGSEKAPAVPVKAGTVRRAEVPEIYRTFAAVKPRLSVSIRPQVTGVLSAAPAEDGAAVKAGQVLFRIAAEPFDAALAQAEGRLGQSTAQLEQARREAARQAELFKKGVSSEGASDQTETAVAAMEATLRMDKAALEQARIQKGYCLIVSPCDGRLGEILVKPGNVVKANETVLAVVNQTAPIEAQFSMPQQQVPGLLAAPERDMRVQASIPGAAGEPEEGTLSFIDHAVDPATGTVKLKAIFANAAERLWPGQFVNIALFIRVEDALAAPAGAIQKSQSGDMAFVIGPDSAVECRKVEVGRLAGDLAVILSGLKEGEQVVTDGQLRLFPGAKVSVVGSSTKGSGTAPGR